MDVIDRGIAAIRRQRQKRFRLVLAMLLEEETPQTCTCSFAPLHLAVCKVRPKFGMKK
jgi:hypothetical protein